MTIYELSATTGYSGIHLSLRRLVSNRSAIEDFKREASEKYVSEIQKAPAALSKYPMMVFVRERETDSNYVFKTVKTTRLDYKFKDGAAVLFEVQQSMK